MDYEQRRLRCKHQEAMLFWLAWEGSVSSEHQATAPAPRKTYRQNWAAYNEAQTTEKARVNPTSRMNTPQQTTARAHTARR